MTGRTGEVCTVAGIYRASCSNRPERTMPKGHVFPPCPHCHSAVTWTLVRRTDTNPGR
jgi:hypothetical protein